MPSAHLLLLEEHAGAGAHLALDALPGLVVRHHRLLQLVLGLKSTRNRINQPIKEDIITSQSHPASGTHQRDQVVALRVRQEALVEERPKSHTNHTAVRLARDIVVLGEGQSRVGGRSDRHLGRHESWTTREGSKAPAPRLAAVAGIRPSARRSATAVARKRWRWKAMALRREMGGGGETWLGKTKRPGCQEPTQRVSTTDSGPDNTWTPIVSERRERSRVRALPSRSGSFQTHAGGAYRFPN